MLRRCRRCCSRREAEEEAKIERSAHYVRDGKNLVAACENFGLKAASSSPKNLLADPKARIEIAAPLQTICRDPLQRMRLRATCRG